MCLLRWILYLDLCVIPLSLCMCCNTFLARLMADATVGAMEVEVIELVKGITITMLHKLVDHEGLELIFISCDERVGAGRGIVIGCQPLIDVLSALFYLSLRQVAVA